MQRRETHADRAFVTQIGRTSDFSRIRSASATVLPPSLELPQLGKPPAQGTLDRTEGRIELRRDLSKAEALEVRPLDHRSLKLRQAKELAPQSVAALRGLLAWTYAVLRGLGTRRRVKPRIIGNRALRTGGLPPQAVDKVAPGDQHHPGHQLGALWIEPIGGLPEPDEDLLHGVLGLGARPKHLPRGLEHERAEARVQLLDRRLVIRGDALHEFPVDALLTLQRRPSEGLIRPTVP